MPRRSRRRHRRSQPPRFAAAPQLTVVDVTVTDKDGGPIDGLTAADFTLTEDGEPQTISLVAFQRIDAPDGGAPPLPTPRPDPSGVAPSVRTPRAAPTVQPTITGSSPGDIRYRNRRLVVLYFDLSAMPPPDQMRAFTAARTLRRRADCAAGCRRDPDASGRRRARQARLHRRSGGASRHHRNADLRRAARCRRSAGRDDRCRHGVRPGRCGVQHPEYRSPALGAADGGVDAAGRCPSRSRWSTFRAGCG